MADLMAAVKVETMAETMGAMMVVQMAVSTVD